MQSVQRRNVRVADIVIGVRQMRAWNIYVAGSVLFVSSMRGRSVCWHDGRERLRTVRGWQVYRQRRSERMRVLWSG